jgi:peptide/nickel transport system permease protein
MSSVSLAGTRIEQPGRFRLLLNYLRRNKGLAIGLAMVFLLTLFTVIGFLTIDTAKAYPLTVQPKQPPGARYLLGTDFFGRDLLAEMVVGMWQTALIGVLAGALGTIIGVVLGFISAYFGGWVDAGIKGLCQILKTDFHMEADGA